MKNNPLFTVFTPTYNRADTLPRVYAALKEQTFKDFEWLIVDDGSTDNTKTLVMEWVRQASFDIRYFYQPNAHKKAAMNRGVREASGAFFLPWDSDDGAPSDALATFYAYWSSIPEEEKEFFSGVCGLCIDEQGRLVGSKFPNDRFVSDSNESRYKYKVTGEKWGFTLTHVMRKYPFPERVAGHVPEGVVWSAIARNYKTLYINVIVRVYYANQDSITCTQQTRENIRKNAPGHALWAKSVLDNEINYFFYQPFWFIKMAINLCRFNLHNKSILLPNSITGKLLFFASTPFGLLRYIRDTKK